MDEIVLDDFRSRFDGWSAQQLVDVDRVLAEFLAFARTASLAAGVGLHIAAEHAAAIPSDLMVGAELDGPADDSPAPADYERGTFLPSVEAFEEVLRREAPGLFEVPIVRLSIDELQEVD